MSRPCKGFRPIGWAFKNDSGALEDDPAIQGRPHLSCLREFPLMRRDHTVKVKSHLPMGLIYPISILRLFKNLMDNAVRHGKAGLASRTRHDCTGLQISILDRGPRISNPVQMREAFMRDAAPQSDIGGGVGLGLAIVDRLPESIGRGCFFYREIVAAWRLE